MTAPGSLLTAECGPHCGAKDGMVRHCPNCHIHACSAARYDRSAVKTPTGAS